MSQPLRDQTLSSLGRVTGLLTTPLTLGDHLGLIDPARFHTARHDRATRGPGG